MHFLILKHNLLVWILDKLLLAVNEIFAHVAMSSDKHIFNIH